ncbi:hypothetical protein Q7C_2366 [Methylophaga frappieri]|uniref:Uncharacterized protein n=1 Tax=Methylophaga frappieri (strain ATCC BAA-2434 / DSM 25690 / JAM7) TaxID=754477 RepID=I1YKQ7_METFJ|nr:hypothetical protein [Methylophaga frappieri]AFJ03500.1 hypothetical protein Q7C_2366 [Methylophaga frappieri]
MAKLGRSAELELRQIMQGLEEFATFMSYRSDYAGLRILSVESVGSANDACQPASAEIIALPVAKAHAGYPAHQPR